MKKLYFVLLLYTFLYSCGCSNQIEENEFNLELRLNSNQNFYQLGYSSIVNLEYNRVMYNIMSTKILNLPLALNQIQTTYVLYGDSISDTIRISGYLVEPVLNDDPCGYQLHMTEPHVSYQTFAGYNFTSYFDNTKYTFYVTMDN